MLNLVQVHMFVAVTFGTERKKMDKNFFSIILPKKGNLKYELPKRKKRIMKRKKPQEQRVSPSLESIPTTSIATETTEPIESDVAEEPEVVMEVEVTQSGTSHAVEEAEMYFLKQELHQAKAKISYN